MSETGERAGAIGWRATTWPRLAVLAALAAAVYAGLPEFMPASLDGGTEFLFVGIELGIVVGLASRVPTPSVWVLAVAAAIGMAVHGVLDVGPPATAIAVAAVVGVEILVLSLLLRRMRGDRLQRPADVFWLLAVAVVVSVAAGALVTPILLSGGVLDGDTVRVLASWVADDVFGLVCIAPAFFVATVPRRWHWGRAPELLAAVLVTLVAAVYLFVTVEPGRPGIFGWPYVVLLGPLWIAVRLGIRAVTPVIAVTFWFAVVQTVDGRGGFAAAGPDPLDRLLAVQAFSIAMAILLLLLAVLRDDRLASLTRLNESSRLLHEVIDATSAVVFAKDYRDDSVPRGRYVLVNQAWERAVGLRAEDVIGRSDSDVLPPEVAEAFVANDLSVLALNEAMTVEEDATSQRIMTAHCTTSKFPLRDAAGRPWGVGGIATDISDVVRAHERERRQAELLRAVFELSPTPAVRLAVSGPGQIVVLDANAAMCRLLEVDEGSCEGCDLMEHIDPDDAEAAREVLSYAAAAAPPYRTADVRQREIRLTTRVGRVVWALMSAGSVGEADEAGDVEIVCQFEDFTARRAAEEALSDQALRDAVTGLPNRRALTERIESALQRLRRRAGLVTVIFCDLDRFKDVNDSLGHQAGDLMLVEVADRLSAALRPEDTIARLGGDEFVVLGEGITEPSDAVHLVLRLQERLGAPWVHGEQVFRPAMSAGIAMTADPEVSVDELLRRADLAMYRAKERGRGRIEVYERAVDDEVQRAVAIQHDLRLAIDHDGLVVHYQPIVRLADGVVVGAEALVRMRGREGVLLGPDAFIPQAEASGLVVPLGAWVLRRVLADVRDLSEGGHALTVAINVSPLQLRDEGFAAYVLAQLADAGVDPSAIAIEVTETALIRDPSRSGRELMALSSAGIGISLDDFGTGYSSLSWLTRFPVDVVKIDRTFTEDITHDDRKAAIVSAVIQVAHELAMTVVAEGVESEAQRLRLVALGCDHAQGYLFGRPEAIEHVAWS